MESEPRVDIDLDYADSARLDYTIRATSLLAASCAIVVLYILIRRHAARRSTLAKLAQFKDQPTSVSNAAAATECPPASTTEIQIDDSQMDNISLATTKSKKSLSQHDIDDVQLRHLPHHAADLLPSGWEQLMSELVLSRQFQRSSREIAVQLDTTASDISSTVPV